MSNLCSECGGVLLVKGRLEACPYCSEHQGKDWVLSLIIGAVVVLVAGFLAYVLTP